jgi:DNA-binding helix-hairpin-helix protein with protein kinase domain
VVDEQGRRYDLGAEIGAGGQGAVHRVLGRPLAVKLRRTSGVERGAVEERVRAVRRLDLSGVRIARPVALLRPPRLGYVMELMEDMQPLSVLIPGDGCPATRDGYLGGGGLRRRLMLLARCADALTRLHGKGLVYGDLSASNVLVSTSPDHDEVQLIDPDNLRYWSEPLHVYTRGYGAPELASGRSGVTTLTDAHAFAVAAFLVLRGVHPFTGDAVVEGESEMENRAFAGELPWIDDPADDSNATTRGLPGDVVLSPLLLDLVQRTFGAGRTAPELRPGVAEWAERLHAAADATVECVGCGSTFFLTLEACPWCDARVPSFVLARFHLLDPEGDRERMPPRVGVRAVCRDAPVRLEGRDVGIWGVADADEPRLELFWNGSVLLVKALDGRRYRAVSGGRPLEVGESEVAIEVRRGAAAGRIHLGPADRVHRVLSFELRQPHP